MKVVVRKKEQLGMNHSTAQNQLKKIVLFELIKELKVNERVVGSSPTIPTMKKTIILGTNSLRILVYLKEKGRVLKLELDLKVEEWKISKTFR